MNGDQLRNAAIKLYGDRGWQAKLAADLRVDGSTVRRWVSGAVSIPGPVEAALDCFLGKRGPSR